MAPRDAYYDGYSPPSSSSPFKSSPTHSMSLYGVREKLTLPSQRAWSQSSDSLELPPLVSDDALTLHSSSSRPHSPSSTPLDTDPEHDADINSLSSPARDAFPFHNPITTRPHTSYFSDSPRTQKAQDEDIATALLALHAYPRFSSTSSSRSPPLSSPVFPTQQYQPQPLPAPQTPVRRHHPRPPALAGLLRTPSPDALPVNTSRAPSRSYPSSDSYTLPVIDMVASKPHLIDNSHVRPHAKYPTRIQEVEPLYAARSTSIPPISVPDFQDPYYRSSKLPQYPVRHVTPPTEPYAPHLPIPTTTSIVNASKPSRSPSPPSPIISSTARLPPLHDSHLINSRPLNSGKTAQLISHHTPGSTNLRIDTHIDDDARGDAVHDMKSLTSAPAYVPAPIPTESYPRAHMCSYSNSPLPPSSPFSDAGHLSPEEPDVDARSRASTPNSLRSRPSSPIAHLYVDAGALEQESDASSLQANLESHEVRFSLPAFYFLPLSFPCHVALLPSVQRCAGQLIGLYVASCQVSPFIVQSDASASPTTSDVGVESEIAPGMLERENGDDDVLTLAAVDSDIGVEEVEGNLPETHTDGTDHSGHESISVPCEVEVKTEVEAAAVEVQAEVRPLPCGIIRCLILCRTTLA